MERSSVPVVPPALRKYVSTKAHDLVFTFNPSADPCTTPVLGQNGGVHKEFSEELSKIDWDTFYFPKLVNHRAMEAMAVAASESGEQDTLVLKTPCGHCRIDLKLSNHTHCRMNTAKKC